MSCVPLHFGVLQPTLASDLNFVIVEKERRDDARQGQSATGHATFFLVCTKAGSVWVIGAETGVCHYILEPV